MHNIEQMLNIFIYILSTCSTYVKYFYQRCLIAASKKGVASRNTFQKLKQYSYSSQL